MLFSEPKIPQLSDALHQSPNPRAVSVLFSEPKIPQHKAERRIDTKTGVSVLFSEPKIPQPTRAIPRARAWRVSVLFSEPKIPQLKLSAVDAASGICFSALQRAENSSTNIALDVQAPPYPFQCSSASRKFLNVCPPPIEAPSQAFQCSSASRKFLNATVPRRFLCYPSDVSVLFSEPKIPQSERH